MLCVVLHVVVRHRLLFAFMLRRSQKRSYLFYAGLALGEKLGQLDPNSSHRVFPTPQFKSTPPGVGIALVNASQFFAFRRRFKWRIRGAAILLAAVLYEAFDVDVVEKLGYNVVYPPMCAFGFEYPWRRFVARRRLMLYRPPPDVAEFTEVGPVWEHLSSSDSLPHDETFRAIVASPRMGKTAASIHAAHKYSGLSNCIPFLRFYFPVLKPAFWGSAAATQEVFIHLSAERGLNTDLARLLCLSPDSWLKEQLLMSMEPLFGRWTPQWFRWLLLPARYTFVVDQFDDARSRLADTLSDALNLSHVARLGVHRGVSCRLLALVKEQSTANEFERMNGGTLRTVGVRPWTNAEMAQVPAMRPAQLPWQPRCTYVRLPSGEVVATPVYCGNSQEPESDKVVQHVAKVLGRSVRLNELDPTGWQSSSDPSTPLKLRATKVLLSDGTTVDMPFCAHPRSSCAFDVAELLSKMTSRPVKATDLKGDWSTSDAIPLELHFAPWYRLH